MKIPTIISSEMARKQFNKNLEKLQNMEMMFSTPKPEVKPSETNQPKKQGIKIT
jgi:hypothetical protein